MFVHARMIHHYHCVQKVVFLAFKYEVVCYIVFSYFSLDLLQISVVARPHHLHQAEVVVSAEAHLYHIPQLLVHMTLVRRCNFSFKKHGYSVSLCGCTIGRGSEGKSKDMCGRPMLYPIAYHYSCICIISSHHRLCA